MPNIFYGASGSAIANLAIQTFTDTSVNVPLASYATMFDEDITTDDEALIVMFIGHYQSLNGSDMNYMIRLTIDGNVEPIWRKKQSNSGGTRLEQPIAFGMLAKSTGTKNVKVELQSQSGTGTMVEGKLWVGRVKCV